MLQSGYLVLADLSGYTEFVTQTELTHSAEILENLIQILLDEVRAPFKVQEIEGDAIFFYTLTDGLERGALLLDMIEGMYRAFRTSLDNTERNSTCDCRACTSVNNLDLKFVVHHGEFAPRGIAGHEGITGSDVILVHRLLKNRIVERLGHSAYAFFSNGAVEALSVDDLTEGMTAHSEEYEHLGEVSGFVYDMAAFWKSELESRHVVVPPEDVFLEMTKDVRAAPLTAWDVYTNPRYRQQWMFSDSYRVTGQSRGRSVTGAMEHCVHGKQEWVHTTLDWKPVRYVTHGIALPFGGMAPITARFDKSEHGTRVTVAFGGPTHEKLFFRTLLRAGFIFQRSSVKKSCSRNVEKYFEIVDSLPAAQES